MIGRALNLLRDEPLIVRWFLEAIAELIDQDEEARTTDEQDAPADDEGMKLV